MWEPILSAGRGTESLRQQYRPEKSFGVNESRCAKFPLALPLCFLFIITTTKKKKKKTSKKGQRHVPPSCFFV